MAQTLKFGNGTWATKKGSTLAYNDENDRYKPLPFTTTRASIATRVNKEGLIEVVENDRPRIDYTDTSDGVLLLEKAATNLYSYSEDFGIGTFTDSLITYSPNTLDVLSPKGDNSSDKFTVTSSGGDANRRITKSISVQNFTASIYVKGEVGQKFHLFVARDGYAELKNGYFTCNGEWQRFSFSDTFTTTSTSVVIGLEFGHTSSDSVANDVYYLWGAQLESGNLSSYIPTQGSAVTRVADTASGAGNSEVFNDSEGVLFADLFFDTKDSTSLLSINDGSTENYVYLGYSSSSNVIRANIAPSGVNLLGNDIQVNIPYKISVKYKQNDFALWVNGFEVDSENSGSTPSNISVLEYSLADLLPFYGKTKEIAYYDTVLTDLELETLTSYRSLNELVTELNLKAL